MKGSGYSIAIAVLVIVAVVLGFLILKQYRAENSTVNKETSTNTASKSTSDIFKPLKKESSREEINARLDAVKEAAKQTDTVDISNCAKPDPAVAEVKLGTIVTLANHGKTAQTVYVGGKSVATVSARSTASLKADFGKGTGMYMYSCDKKTFSGYFLVTP